MKNYCETVTGEYLEKKVTMSDYSQEKQNVRGHVTRHDLSALDPTEKSFKCHSLQHTYAVFL